MENYKYIHRSSGSHIRFIHDEGWGYSAGYYPVPDADQNGFTIYCAYSYMSPREKAFNRQIARDIITGRLNSERAKAKGKVYSMHVSRTLPTTSKEWRDVEKLVMRPNERGEGSLVEELSS